MKKFLQKTLALLALCLVSLSAMAQSAEFDYLNTHTQDNWTYTEGEVNSFYNHAWWGYGVDIYYNNGGYLTYTSEKNIVKIEFDTTCNIGSLIVESGGGSISLSGSMYTWTGSTKSITFNGTGNEYDIAISNARIWLEGYVEQSYEYTVNIVNCPAGATVTYEGTPYANGTKINSTKLITNDKLTASKHVGYYLESIQVGAVDAENKGTITATYQVFSPINKTVYGRMYNNSSVKIGEDFLVEYNQTSPTEFEILDFFGTGRTLFVNLATTPISMMMEGGNNSGEYKYLNSDYNGSSFNGDNAGSVQPEASRYDSSNKILSLHYYSYETGSWNNEYKIFFNEEYVAPTPVATFDMSAAGWATLCINNDFTVPAGYNAYVVGKEVNREAVAVENGELVLTAITDVPAGVAVLISGSQDNGIELFAPASTPAKPAVNFLRGNVTNSNLAMTSDMFINDAPTDAPATYDYIAQYGAGSRLYKLSYLNGENLGFYFDAANGASYTCKPNRACLVLPAAQASSNSFKIRFAEDVVTGINAIATEKAEAIYNLQGQRVNATQAGVYVKNGKKFIVK